MNNDQLGKIPGMGAMRDAIHIAIAPVVAAKVLSAGDHVGPTKDGRYAMTSNPVGIVDPFRGPGVIAAGEKFWLLLYPNTITTLRHNWTHPAFSTEEGGPVCDKAAATNATKLAAIKWLTDFAKHECHGTSYEELIQGVEDGYVNAGTNEELEATSEFWENYALATGAPATPEQKNEFYFSCSC